MASGWRDKIGLVRPLRRFYASSAIRSSIRTRRADPAAGTGADAWRGGGMGFFRGPESERYFSQPPVLELRAMTDKPGRPVSPCLLDGNTWRRQGRYIAAKGSGLWHNNEFFYWYQAGDLDGVMRIGLARSSDGLHFRKESKPVLDVGPYELGRACGRRSLRHRNRWMVIQPAGGAFS
jgi:hypothetical protein